MVKEGAAAPWEQSRRMAPTLLLPRNVAILARFKYHLDTGGITLGGDNNIGEFMKGSTRRWGRSSGRGWLPEGLGCGVGYVEADGSVV